MLARAGADRTRRRCFPVAALCVRAGQQACHALWAFAVVGRHRPSLVAHLQVRLRARVSSAAPGKQMSARGGQGESAPSTSSEERSSNQGKHQDRKAQAPNWHSTCVLVPPAAWPPSPPPLAAAAQGVLAAHVHACDGDHLVAALWAHCTLRLDPEPHVSVRRGAGAGGEQQAPRGPLSSPGRLAPLLLPALLVARGGGSCGHPCRQSVPPPGAELRHTDALVVVMVACLVPARSS